jgi:hypothetical protein
MEIIEVLTPQYDKCPSFDVVSDGSVTSVPVALSAGSCFLGIFDDGFNTRFQERDNIRLLTMGIYLPEAFCFADTVRGNTIPPLISMIFTVYDYLGNYEGFLPNVGSAERQGTFQIVFPNYETGLDFYCDMASYPGDLPNNEYQINCFMSSCPDISMIGVPAALNGKTIKIIPFIKIFHTKRII